MSHHGPHRSYRVAGKLFYRFDEAAGRAIALGMHSKEHVAIAAFERGRLVKTIDVTAALSTDVPTTYNDQITEG